MSDRGDARLFEAPSTPAETTSAGAFAAGPALSHADLVLKAGRWLKNTLRCKAVLLEPGYGSPSEIPDAIGWTSRASVVVECKATRKDFLADRRKPGREPAGRESGGLGDERWYMTPGGLVRPDEIPEGWGLLEVRASRVYRKVRAPRRAPLPEYLRRERCILASCLAAVQRREEGLELLPSRHLDHNLGPRLAREEGGT